MYDLIFGAQTKTGLKKEIDMAAYEATSKSSLKF